MELIRNKKGVFFTILALFMVGIFVLSYTFTSNIDDRISTHSRINSLNNFVFSLENDLSRKLYAFSYRTIFLIERKIFSSGNYQSNVTGVFQDSFFTGQFEGVSDDLLTDIYSEAIVSSINQDSQRFNVLVNITSKSLEITQEDPWNLKVVWNITMNVTDVSGLASWNKNESIVSFVSITNFDDPIYFVNTNGLVPNKFNKTIYSPIYVSGGSVANLSNHVVNSLYNASSQAPSFLNRLAGNLSADPNGIESFVNLAKLSAQGISTTEKSNLDYIYFSGSNPLPLCTVPGLSSKIDNQSAQRYDISC